MRKINLISALFLSCCVSFQILADDPADIAPASQKESIEAIIPSMVLIPAGEFLMGDRLTLSA